MNLETILHVVPTVEQFDRKELRSIKNEELLAEILACQSNGKEVSQHLLDMYCDVIFRLTRSMNYDNHVFRQEMEAYALYFLNKCGLNFDSTKSNNPFGYFTQIVKNAFINLLSWKKKDPNWHHHSYNP